MRRVWNILAVIVIAGLVVIILIQHGNTQELRRLVELRDQEESVAQTKNQETNSGGLETEVQRPEPVQQGRYLFPVAASDYTLTSPHGVRVSPITKTIKYHSGLDISSVWRAQVVSVADGTVIEHWPPPDGYYRGHEVYGGMIIIDHGEGIRSLYAHLSTTYVHEGYEIKAGEVIGRIGATGVADGEHLHFELQLDGKAVNPLLYIEEGVK
jgi:murein DD-endopeptidase MepM/ murein hydrolase activator NlpD